MGAELGIVFGLSVISALFAHYAFELKNTTNEFLNKVSIFLLFFSLLFLNLVMYSLVLISQNGVAYLEESIVNTGLLIMMWFTVAATTFYFIYLILMSVKSLGKMFDDLHNRFKGRGKKEYAKH